MVHHAAGRSPVSFILTDCPESRLTRRKTVLVEPRRTYPHRMPGPASTAVRMTLAEYLATEESSPVKREFHDGEVLAMSGGTYNHARVAGNLLAAAANRLTGNPRSANNSDP